MTAVTYEHDLAAWLNQQLGYLKAGQYDKIDMDNFVEEVEGVVKTEKRSMKSHFIILICHMLKWEFQPEKRSGSWLASIMNARREIQDIVDDSPSLVHHKQVAYEQAWERGKKMAMMETGIPYKDLPETCLWSLSDILHKRVSREDGRG